MADQGPGPSDFTAKKKVDESWKDTVQKERDVPHESAAEELLPPDPDFPFFVSTLGMQALAAMGEIPDPVSREKKANLPQAKYLIDVIGMLRERTRGNLSQDEEAALESLLYELQMKFVQKNQNP